MIVDFSSHTEVLKITTVNFLKLIIMAYLAFYKLPQYLYPQTHMEDLLDKIVLNVLYMITTIVIVIPLLLFLKIFSLITLGLSFFFIKVLSVYYFEKKNYFTIIKEKYYSLMCRLYDSLEDFYRFQKFGRNYKAYKSIFSVGFFLNYKFLRYFISILITVIIIYNINIINFISLSDRASDIPLYTEWVAMMKQYNGLYLDNLTIGAYFFGPPVIIFFLQLITNIDSTIIMSLYPILFFIFLLIGIYYIIYKFTSSHNSALFAIIIFGLYCLSPISTYILGYIYKTANPNIFNLYGLKIYFNLVSEIPKRDLIDYSYIPYIRINAGLPYEMALSFYPYYIYFFIKSFTKKDNFTLLLYGITLFLCFTFHGGIAVYLIPASIFILINAMIFKKIDFKIFKKGLLTIVIATLLGNVWVLSMLKYGIPQHFGIAAPLLDFLFKTKEAKIQLQKVGITRIYELVFYKVQILIYILLLLLYPISFFFKKNKKFLLSSLALSIISLVIIYVEVNLGFPRIVSKARSAEFLLVGVTFGAGLYFYIFEKSIILLFKKFAKWILTLIIILFFISSIFTIPQWNDKRQFFKSLDDIEYNAIVLDIYKIKKIRRPFSWTVVGFVQSYSKVLGEGFHMNVQEFLKRYNPYDKYLKIPTDFIYIFKETLPGTYKGSGEWFFRWKKDLELQLETWINIYTQTHHNIRVFDNRKFLTVYEIDNREYMKFLYSGKRNEFK